ncbi:FAD-dependent oxidoreductase [Demequina capsici]|uniref:NAD(P)-binding domain-containing protein n=1 Tax=Demequina capsici TaxID=3075620 RepID=A0AA96FBM2_9MICO|nr:FAD-dependent oxidoreductase [Demequina sp. OYTSA14]WNM25601.1 NAD(P)-binding domain-containing protein [Demequina sp. OYTSA14]
MTEVPAAQPSPADVEARLDALRSRIHDELDLLDYGGRDWVPSPGHDVLDVLIVGGGHAGQALAFALARKDVRRVLVVDGAPVGLEGPWSTQARMRTLRTPKMLKGPDNDVPALAPREWFVARYGRERWDAIRFIPRLDWQEYLQFYREVTGIDVVNETAVTSVAPPTHPDGPFIVTLSGPDGQTTRLAQRVIFATGLEGAGGVSVPQHLFHHLPKSAWGHTSHMLDFDAMKGMRIGVLGGGASAFDVAGTALEHGAADVQHFMRRAQMPAVNPLRWMEYASFVEHFCDWDDAHKWDFMRKVLEIDQPSTQSSIWRCFEHDNYKFALGSPWLSTRMDGDEVVVDVAGTEHRFDYVIAGTGVAVDLRMRPELAPFVDQVALWSDRFTPASGKEHLGLAAYPYLTGSFQFTAKNADAAPWMARLYHFAQGARVTMGITGHQLSGLPAGVQRLVWGLTRDLFREHQAAVRADFDAYDERELISLGPRPADQPPIQRHASSSWAERLHPGTIEV